VPVGLGQDDFHDFELSKAVYATGRDGNIRVVINSDGTIEEIQTD
jgi:hypothetical protein